MTYLFSTYWLWMLLALVLGGVVGFATFLRSGKGWWPDAWPGWFKLLGLLFLVGLVVAIFKWLPGLLGHYLETALLFVGSYIVGCFLGSWLASFRSREEIETSEPVAVAEPAPVRVTPPAPAPVPAPVTARVVTPPPVVTPIPTPAPVRATASAPVSAAPAGDHLHPGQRPPAVAKGVAALDDLKLIDGVGPVNEGKLNELGIWTFKQIAAWTPANAEWVGSYMAFPGRIEREDWIGQAAQLAKGLGTGSSTPTTATVSAPVSAASVGDEIHPGQRPPSAAKGAATPDNLKRISGIGHVNEEKLNELGIWTFAQIAAWTPANAEWVGSYMAFPGRIEREDWIEQAAKLAKGIETEFSRRVDQGDVPTSS
jgi:predicted flap endonuclease-1-like 5' DNA nuclease